MITFKRLAVMAALSATTFATSAYACSTVMINGQPIFSPQPVCLVKVPAICGRTSDYFFDYEAGTCSAYYECCPE